MRTYQQYPDLAAEIITRFQAINYNHTHAFQAGLKSNPNYDLDFALAKLIEAERHYVASQGGKVVVTDDMALRDREGYFHWMAETVGIHRNWPQYLLKPYEMDAWIAHYEAGVRECNQAGFYLREVLSIYHFEKIPEHLHKKYNVHSPFYFLISIAMLCKIRWYERTQSRHHKPDRLALYNQEFIDQVINQLL